MTLTDKIRGAARIAAIGGIGFALWKIRADDLIIDLYRRTEQVQKREYVPFHPVYSAQKDKREEERDKIWYNIEPFP